MSLAEIKIVTEVYNKAVKEYKWQKELECLASLKLLYCREGDRVKDAKRVVAKWKLALEKYMKLYRSKLTPQQLHTYSEDLKNCYKYESEYLFESFLFYMEWNRPNKERFYHPRQKQLKVCVDAMQDLADGKLKILAISMPPRIGKAQTLDSNVLTPNGFVRMGDIKVGDKVISGTGNICNVTGVFPQGEKEVFNVVFDDASSAKCCKEHLWRVQTADDRTRGNVYRTVELQHMMGNYLQGKVKRSNYSLDYVAPIEFVKRDLLLHPYVMGALLGDGSLSSGNLSITKGDIELIDKFRLLLPDYDTLSNKRGITYRIKKKNKKEKNEKGFLVKCETAKALDDYGLTGTKSDTKFIPKDYKLSCIEDRWELLRGLLDTDGYTNGSFIEYSSASYQLSQDVIDVVHSLGGYAKRSAKKIGSYTKNGEKFICKETFRVIIQFGSDAENPFSLSRKANKYKPLRNVIKRFITKIEPCGKEQCQCIMVDDPSHLYVTDDYIITHNTTLGIFYCLWMGARNHKGSVFMSGHSTALTKTFYSELLNLISDDKYNYKYVFPDAQLVDTDALNGGLDLGEPKRYKTFALKSIDQRISGQVEASTLLYVDDLISGTEEASKPERLDNALAKYLGDIKQRRTDNVPLLMIGTRWSLNDPIGIEEREHADDPMAKFIVMPALDEEGQSNFDFPYKGFSTAYYMARKRELDMIDESWFPCQYQQIPMEGSGICFGERTLNRYYGNDTLNREEKDGTFAFTDVAWGGGDSLSMPIGEVYTVGGVRRVYIVDWIFSRDDKSITQPLVEMAIQQNKVQEARFESNNGGSEYAEEIGRQLRAMGYACRITWGKAPTTVGKITKIKQYAPDIKTYFYFLDNEHQSSQYKRAFRELTAWLITGKSPHEDAPDSLAGLSEMVLGSRIGVVTSGIDRNKYRL